MTKNSEWIKGKCPFQYERSTETRSKGEFCNLKCANDSYCCKRHTSTEKGKEYHKILTKVAKYDANKARERQIKSEVRKMLAKLLL